jgi:hypothetical protein
MKQHTPRLPAHVVLTLAGMAGIVGLFLPFAWKASPLEVATDRELWRLVLPAFLAFPASAASVRWIISGRFSRPERVIAYCLSVVMAGLSLSFWFSVVGRPSTTQEWLFVLAPPTVLASGIALLIRNSRIRRSHEYNPVLALQAAYLADVLMGLMMWFPEWESGAYCVLLAALAFGLQIVLVTIATVPASRQAHPPV